MSTKFCKDCKHSYCGYVWECWAPHNMRCNDLVTGYNIQHWKSCKIHRADGFLMSRLTATCGKEARWFESRGDDYVPPPYRDCITKEKKESERSDEQLTPSDNANNNP
jgi:hypothetical protein